MLRDILQNIMSANMPDKLREVLIAKTLTANQEFGEEDCVSIFDVGVRWVLEGDRPTVTALGWLVMQHLKEFQQTIVSELLNVAMLEKLLRYNTSSHNRAEVPALVAWSLSIVSTQAMEEAVGNMITDFLKETVRGDISVLVNVSKLLCEHPRCIPVSDERGRLCEVMTASVADVPMPRAQPAQVSQLVKQMGFIQTLLDTVWKGEAEKIDEQLVFRCLSALHTTLIDHPAEPCPALAGILHLVYPHFIPKYVKAILQAKQSHSRTLHTLCQWLCCWPHNTRLSPWVMALINGLEEEQQFGVLMEVTLATIQYLFAAIMLPVVRCGVIRVVWHMIASSRHSPHVFHKVVNQIPTVIAQLLRENSDSSHTCLQMVVNMSCAMVAAFPRNDNMYDPLIRALKDCSSYLPPGEFVPDNMPTWLSADELYRTENHKSRERSGRVGLNNLGNTCYMNSILQALFMTHRFCCAVLDGNVQSQPLLSKLQAVFALLLNSQRQAISPTMLLAVARPPGFQPGYQQDSSEFLTYLLDVLHEQEKHATTQSGTTIAGDEGTEADAGEAAGSGALVRWMTEEDLSNQNVLQCKACSLADVTQAAGDDVQQLNNFHSISTDSGIQSVCGEERTATASSPVPYESLVQQCFGGRLLINFKCLQCKAESVHTDHFRDIQLAFPPDCSPDHKLHIQDLLDYFISPEHLSGENRYQCDSCGGLHDAWRTIQIIQSPSHLVLTLKLFQFNSATGQRTKLLHWVHCSESIQLYQQSYKLYAAVIHSGSNIDTGHYYTLARDETLVWHMFNDSLVVPCDPPPWSPPDTPYILFYTRFEEKLQPAVDLLSLPSLHSHLMELVNRDDFEWRKEIKSEEERHRERGKQQSSLQPGPHNPDKDSNNGGNPPGSCGGGGMDLSHNRFVF